MNETIKLTPDDIQNIKSNVDETTRLIKHYSIEYKGQEHYDHLGASCVMSATNTIDTVIGSAQYLDWAFLMPDYGRSNVPSMTKFLPSNDKEFTTKRQLIYLSIPSI